MISFTTFLAICYLTSSFWFILNNRGFHFFFLNNSSEKLWNKYFLDCYYYQWMTSPLPQNLKIIGFVTQHFILTYDRKLERLIHLNGTGGEVFSFITSLFLKSIFISTATNKYWNAHNLYTAWGEAFMSSLYLMMQS